MLSVRNSDSRNVVEVKNAAGPTLPVSVWFPAGYTALQVEAVRDANFNGVPEIAALLNEKQQGVKKRFVTLKVDAGEADAPYMSTLWHGGEVVGETTSGAWGYRVDASIALGMLRTDLTEPGTEIEVDIFGQRCKAVVQDDAPMWDPQNERIRA